MQSYRAAILGISSKQLEPALEEVITPSRSNIVEHSPAHVETINRVIKAVEKGSDEEISFKRLEKENKELKEEIHQLEIGMREIHGALKAPGSGQVFQVPSLDKLIAIIQERHATGQYDTTVQLKAEVSHLLGRNEELRSELRNAQAEISQGIMELNKKTQKMDVLEKEVESLRELNEGVVKLNPLPLPEGVAPTSKDIIACLNEYLIQILQELSNKEELCEKMESNLEEIRRNYSVATHQQSILYKEFLENQKEVEEIKKKFNEEKESLMHSKNENDVKVQEFQKLLENLQVDPSSHKKLLAELTRKITVLRVNEKSLTRRYTVLQDTEKAVRKENAKLHNGMMELEAAVTKKIGDLQRHKEMSVYKITSLQKSLEDTVPSLELDQANRQFNELTAKYRDLLQKENQLAAHSVALDTLKAELKAWQHSDKTLKDQLQLEKEKSYVLEQTLNDLITKLGEQADGTQHKAEEVTLLARKMATLEIKELNERERADHANTKYEQMRSLVTELENRNSELEQKFAEISKVNLECQRIERELRDELTTCVPADVNRANKTQIKKMEEKCGQLQNDNSRLKELAEISQHQVESITMRQQSQEKELISIRKRLNEMQMETDEKTVIAKLHQQIVALQVSESAAVRKLEVANKKLSRTDALNLKLQGIIDEKDEMLFQIRYEGRSKSKFLKKTIQDLRRQFSGALTLGKQEKFSTSLRSYQQKKLELEKELQEARNKRILAEDQSLELQLKLAGLQDLIVTLKDSQGAKKVAEWHNRMSEVKLEDLKLKREIENLKEQMRYYENMITKHENTITLLEEENIKQTKEFEDRQLLWEQHEVELERSVAKLEKQQRDIMEAAQKFEEATGSILDESMPISHQLEIAIGKIKEHIKTIIFTREETNRAHEKMQAAETKLRAAETSLMQKDKVINELRLRLPISERNYYITDIVSDVKPMSQEENRDVKQALKIAQTTVDSLKLMLQKKDENISKYQQLLEKSRKELQSQSESHHHEMKLLQDRLQLEVEEHIKKMKKIHHDYINAPQTKVATNEQLQRLSELEEIVEEQDTALGTASEKYRQGKASLKTLKERLENNIKLMNNKMKDLESKHVAEVKKLKDKIEIDANMIREKELEIEVLHQELEASKEANERAPSKTMKNLVERLRNQLAKKDKEQKSLSQALLQLRSDMVSTAEENVHAYSKKMEEELNVQKLVERETNQLNDRIEDLQIRMEKLRKELRKKKESENELNSEIETLKKDNLRKENALKELALELRNREDLVEKYDKLKADYKKMEKTRKVTDKKEEVLQEDTIQAQEVEAVAAAREFSDLDEKPVKESKEEIIRWEESKKWQKKIENLKTKLKDKTSEYVQCEKTNTMLREAVARQEKDKMILQNRLKSVSKGDNAGKALSALNQEDTIASLKSRIFQLEDENNELVRKLNVDRDREFQELQIQNNQLKESLRALETELMNQQKEFDPDGYTWNLHREQALQKEMLDIRKENMELRFETEQATKDCPRLKARVEDLTEYTEILKGEIESLRKKDKSKKVAMGTGMGGQSVEDMERVIAAMRRVVERLQTENESLKKQAGKPKPHSDLVKENRILKQEVQRLKQVQTKTDHKSVRVSTPPATVKVIQENDKLRKELKKEKEETEQLRVNNDGLRKINEKLQEELEEKNQTISAINRKAETMTTSTDRKLNKSIVVSKLYDQKIKSLENEVQKKNSILKEIKSHLRGSAEREAELLRKIDELEDKVTFLQNYPPGNHSDQDSAKLLQQTRLQVRRLEAEKKELQFELERLRKITSNGETPVDVTQDEVLEKLRSYDKMLAVEVDLRTRIKGMEIEREKLYSENKKLKKELSAFDPSFFEELEDLKYNYKKAVERNIVYENQLRELSKQFGVNVNIRPSHDESL